MKTVAGVEKPLAEWTLKDVKECCKLYWDRGEVTLDTGHKYMDCMCYKCPLSDIVCKYKDEKGRTPFVNIQLEEKQKFTTQEIEDAKFLLRILGENGVLSKNYPSVHSCCCKCSGRFVILDESAFPSIKRGGREYSLYEIIGGEYA